MYCSKCGVQNSDGATQCVNCGGVLMDTPQQAEVQPVPVAVAEPKTSGLAIAAFVMGLLSMTCILWPFLGLPAIVCGIISLVKIGNSKGQLKGTGLAVAGLVIPAVLTLVVPMVLAIMMPALSRTKKIAQRVVCATNLKGLSVAMMVYANDYDGALPTENWCDLFVEEVDVSPKSFVCPDSDAIEQAIRFVVIDRYITQGTRSEKGRLWSERIWTVMATCASQGRNAFDFICQSIQAHFSDQPFPSLLGP